MLRNNETDKYIHTKFVVMICKQELYDTFPHSFAAAIAVTNTGSKLFITFLISDSPVVDYFYDCFGQECLGTMAVQ